MIPPQVEHYYDLGYQAVETDFPNIKIVVLIKKKCNTELTKKEKRYNKRHSRQSNRRTYNLQGKEVWYYGKQVQK